MCPFTHGTVCSLKGPEAYAWVVRSSTGLTARVTITQRALLHPQTKTPYIGQVLPTPPWGILHVVTYSSRTHKTGLCFFLGVTGMLRALSEPQGHTAREPRNQPSLSPFSDDAVTQ